MKKLSAIGYQLSANSDRRFQLIADSSLLMAKFS